MYKALAKASEVLQASTECQRGALWYAHKRLEQKFKSLRQTHTKEEHLQKQRVLILANAMLLVAVWGRYAASVDYGMTLPGTGYSLWYVFLTEMVMTFLVVLSIFIFVSSHRLMRWTPLMTWFLVATMVWLGASISGTSINPARSFGPALVTWRWQDQWLYWIAPPLGAMIAVGVFRLLAMGDREILTAKLFHMPHYRCIFKNIKVPHLKPRQSVNPRR